MLFSNVFKFTSVSIFPKTNLTEAVRNHMPRQKLKIETSLETPASDWSV
jgi:hypothetical protein